MLNDTSCLWCGREWRDTKDDLTIFGMCADERGQDCTTKFKKLHRLATGEL